MMADGKDVIVKAVSNKYPNLTQENEGTWKGPYFFIQAADTQLGLIDNWNNVPEEELTWDKEIELTRQAVKIANAMQPRPRFLIICGDLVDAFPWKKYYKPQVQDLKISLKDLSNEIPLVCVCGNHDIGDTPTRESIQAYRQNFGDDYFTFWVGGVIYIVINSQYYQDSSRVPEYHQQHDQWLDQVLESVKTLKPQHVVVFQHIPWFLQAPDEPTEYFNIALEKRSVMLEKLKSAGVRKVFCGHYHRNAGGFDGNLEVVVTSAIGLQIGDDLSGMRIVKVNEDKITHKYYDLNHFPTNVEIP